MKKILAFILTLTVLFSLSIPAYAAVISPEEPVTSTHTVTCYGVANAKDGSKTSVKDGETITLTADKTKGTFEKWTISGKYTITSGNLTSETITIKPESNLTVTANFSGSSNPSSPDESSSSPSPSSSSPSSSSPSSSSPSSSSPSNPSSNPVTPVVVRKGDSNKNGKYDVRVIGGQGVNKDGSVDAKWNKNTAVIDYDAEKNQLTVTAIEDNGKFDNWTIYTVTENGKKKEYNEAVEGTDYKLVINDPEIEKELGENFTLKDYMKKKNVTLEQLLSEKRITVIPLADIIICGNYNGKITSPKTSDHSIFFVFAALIALAGVTVTTKKILSK